MGKKNKKRRKPPPRRKPAVTAVANPVRLMRRITRLRPRCWDKECVEDVAVFDDAALASLNGDIAEQVIAVRESLQCVYESLGDEAKRRLSSIPRSSSMSQWRLLIRGLIDWYDDEVTSASDAWSRLDPQRRPARIASALLASGHDDLDTLKPPSSLDACKEGFKFESFSLDATLISAAKLVRQTRIDRPAIREAERESAIREKQPGGNRPPIHLGPERLKWLKRFAAEYRQIEPQLVESLQRGALDRAFKQPYVDLFNESTGAFAGPGHDPKNTLFKSLYHTKFEGGEQLSKRLMRQYLTKELAGNEQISKPLRAAILSQAYLDAARAAIEPQEIGMFGAYWGDAEDDKQINSDFNQAIKCFPANQAAHREYTEWIQQRLENGRLDKPSRTRFEKRLPMAMEQWSKGLPKDIEPRLWLVDDYLENEQLDEAKPHIEWLSDSRHPDPRVRAMPWKWQLLEAMRLCRRKAWLPQVTERLDAAVKLWPAWLSKDWLPYLRAALSLRMENLEEYQRQRDAIGKELAFPKMPFSALADDLMMLAAAQRMRVPAAALKPLRQPIDQAVSSLTMIPMSALIAAGAFFWSLHRTSMLYPAYRMHGSKFATELKDRFKAMPRLEPSVQEQAGFWDAVLWLSERRCFQEGYEIKVPRSLQRLDSEPKLAAAIIHTILSARSSWRVRDHHKDIDRLRAAATDSQDPYYRYWFDRLVCRAEEELAKVPAQRTPLGGFFDLFNRFAQNDANSFDDDDWDDDDDTDGLGFDPQCLCPECTAAREAVGYPHPIIATAEDEDDEQREFDFQRVDASAARPFEVDPNLCPPVPPRPKMEIPRDLELRRTRPKNPMAKKRTKNNR